MDFRAARTEHTAAVPLGGDFAVGMVLRGGTGSGREFAIDAVDRRAIHTEAVLRNPEDGLVARRARTRGQRKTGTPADAADGAGSNLSEATAVGSRVRAQDLSVSAAQSQDRSARPRLVRRYHLHSPAAGLCLSGGDHGLVQPLCAGVGSIDFAREGLLRGGTGLGIDDNAAGDFQYRPGGAVHQRGIYEPSREAGHHDQHGRTRTSRCLRAFQFKPLFDLLPASSLFFVIQIAPSLDYSQISQHNLSIARGQNSRLVERRLLNLLVPHA
jgi:hypothetical protein